MILTIWYNIATIVSCPNTKWPDVILSLLETQGPHSHSDVGVPIILCLSVTEPAFNHGYILDIITVHFLVSNIYRNESGF